MIEFISASKFYEVQTSFDSNQALCSCSVYAHAHVKSHKCMHSVYGCIDIYVA